MAESQNLNLSIVSNMLMCLKSYKNAYVFKSMYKVKNLNNFLNCVLSLNYVRCKQNDSLQFSKSIKVIQFSFYTGQ